MYTIDINCDVGEGLENEDLLMPHITSCNIACGAHAGSVDTIDRTIQMAVKNNVKIGAHPSFPDRKNFGRKVMEMDTNSLGKSIKTQIDLLLERTDKYREKLHHVKVHGALYNLAAVDENIAKMIVHIMKYDYENTLFLYVPYNSVIEKIALEHEIKIKYEAFADRNYNDDLTLVSRTMKNAVITDKETAFEHVYRMISNKRVRSVSGKEMDIKADTFCVHGDTVNAVELVEYITKELRKKAIEVG